METIDRAELGKRLKRIREDRGLNQQQLASMAGVGIKTVYNLEKGLYKGTNPPSLDAVCQTLGVSIDDVTGNDATDPRNRRPADTDAEKLMRTLSSMPVDVRVAMYVLGGWLSKLPEDRRSAEIDRLILLTVESPDDEQSP